MQAISDFVSIAVIKNIMHPGISNNMEVVINFFHEFGLSNIDILFIFCLISISGLSCNLMPCPAQRKPLNTFVAIIIIVVKHYRMVMMETKETIPFPGILPRCHDCGAIPGQPHDDGCDVERCSVCGMQRISCDCAGHDKSFARWTGLWPGEAEAGMLGLDLNGLYAKGFHKLFFIKPIG
jgi:hypothetical protein